jgi:hypothetical protein
MALVLYGGGIIDARGSVSGNTLSRSKFGSTMRAKTSPIIPVSTTRGGAQGLLVQLSRNWSILLNETERAMWNAFALVNPATNVFGQVSYLSGQQWYVRINANLTLVNGTLTTTPPATASYPGLTTLVVGTTGGTPGTIGISWTSDTPAGTPVINFFATQNVSPGIFYVNSLLRRVNYVALSGTSADITGPYTTRFPNTNILTGKKIFVLANLIDQDSGASGPGIIASAIAS